MKLKRSTFVLLLLALGLGGFVYFYEIQGATQRQEAEQQQQQIFSFREEQVQSLTVRSKDQILRFERSSQPGPTKWRMKSPSDTPASDASVAYLLDLLVNGKSDRTLQVPVARLQEYGLQEPQTRVEVKLNNQESHRLILGQPDFSRSFLYAQADPPVQPTSQVDVLLVSTNFENAVNRPLSEWQQDRQLQERTTDRPTPQENK